MNKLYKIILLLSASLMMLTACEDDVKYELSGSEIVPELQTVLSSMGYQFEGGKLVINPKVITVTSLNLSDKGFKDPSIVTGLEAFTNLEDLNLDGNDFSEINSQFFRQLPGTISTLSLNRCGINKIEIGVNSSLEELRLGGNKFRNIQGLSTENLPSLSRITIPASARWNYEEIISFYKKNKDAVEMEVDMDGKGTCQAYNGRMKVPNDKFREFLQKSYPSVFEGDEIILDREPEVNDGWFGGNTEWKWEPGNDWPATFVATGMGQLDGIEFFQNRCIKKLVITFGEVEELNFENDMVIEHLSFGRDYTTDWQNPKPDGYNPAASRINIRGCKNLKDLTVSGQISELDMTGCDAIERLTIGGKISELDLSDKKNLQVVYNLGAGYGDKDYYGKELPDVYPLRKVVLPKEGKGLTQVSLDKTEISELDFSGVVVSGYSGCTVTLSQCPNLEKIVYGDKLGMGSSFADGYFKEIDLRGATIWDGKALAWVDAVENNPLLIKNNPNLEKLNGEEYENKPEEYPDYVQTLNVMSDEFREWIYYHFTSDGQIEEVGRSLYEDISTGGIAEVDNKWKERKDWDFAIHNYNIRTNSGLSGNAGGGLYESKFKTFPHTQISAAKLSDFEYKEDKMIRTPVNGGIPPTIMEVSLSPVEVFTKTGSMPPVFLKKNSLYALKCADGRYAVLRFDNYYTNDEPGNLTIKYHLAK